MYRGSCGTRSYEGHGGDSMPYWMRNPVMYQPEKLIRI